MLGHPHHFQSGPYPCSLSSKKNTISDSKKHERIQASDQLLENPKEQNELRAGTVLRIVTVGTNAIMHNRSRCHRDSRRTINPRNTTSMSIVTLFSYSLPSNVSSIGTPCRGRRRTVLHTAKHFVQLKLAQEYECTTSQNDVFCFQEANFSRR